MKRFSIFLAVAALGLIILIPALALASSSLLFDRGLPTQYFNDAAGSNRSNVAWADGEATATTSPYWLPGDDFKIGTGGSYNIDTIRVWTVGNNTGLTLFGGQEGGTISQLSNTFTPTAVTYTNNEGYQGNSGAFSTIYQIDFAVNWNVSGGVKYQFFLDGPWNLYNPDKPADGYVNAFLHASNAALSGSTQEGADDTFLWLTMTDGVPGSVITFWDADTNPYWDKLSDGNVQVFGTTPIPGSVLLLGSGLVGLAFLGRRKLIKRS